MPETSKIISKMKKNILNSAIDFLSKNAFPTLNVENIEGINKTVDKLAAERITMMLINPFSGNFQTLTYPGDQADRFYFTEQFLLPVECWMYKFIKPTSEDENLLWSENLIPILDKDGEIRHKDGRPLAEEELKELNLEKAYDANGNHLKVKAFANKGRVVYFPGPWVVPYRETREGIVILKTLIEVSELYGKEVKREELQKVILELVKQKKIKIKLASELQFKGVGCHMLNSQPDNHKADLPKNILAKFAEKNVFIPGLPYSVPSNSLEGGTVTFGGVGACMEAEKESLPMEEEARGLGVIFYADTVRVRQLFTKDNFPELADNNDKYGNHYNEIWFSVRLGAGTPRLDMYLGDDPETILIHDKVLTDFLSSLFPNLTREKRLEFYLAYINYNLTKIFIGSWISKSSHKRIATCLSNYDPFFRIIDTDEGSFTSGLTEKEWKNNWQKIILSAISSVLGQFSDETIRNVYFKDIILPSVQVDLYTFFSGKLRPEILKEIETLKKYSYLNSFYDALLDILPNLIPIEDCEKILATSIRHRTAKPFKTKITIPLKQTIKAKDCFISL
ncbi:MAG: hypothetical protein ABII74_04370 [Elusimicrobiota bacterium]